ncbi:MAG TPA: dienelactone hydrolase family protein [Actinomycetota bacterium]|nr:dienelactone hydrolase family protein [Actinomycetota bacterium]
MYEGMIAETVRITGTGGDLIDAYLARPLGPGPVPGVIVIHHAPGWDQASREMTRKFAAHGYAAVCPHLYHREGAGMSPEDAAAAGRAAGGVPDERLLGDVGGALAHLRALPYASGKVGVIGFCSGGRQTFLTACTLPVDAAVDCYGACVLKPPPPTLPLKMTPCIDRAPGLSCPLLGLFGEEDTMPSPEETAAIAAVLEREGKTFEFHTYPNAGHGFFAVDRPMYRQAAATDGWAKVFGFFERYLTRSEGA